MQTVIGSALGAGLGAFIGERYMGTWGMIILAAIGAAVGGFSGSMLQSKSGS